MSYKIFAFWTITIVIAVIRITLNRPNYHNGDLVRISAKVESESVIYDTSQGIEINGLWMYLPLFPRIYYGDTIIVEGSVADGKLKNPQLLTLKKILEYCTVFEKRL